MTDIVQLIELSHDPQFAKQLRDFLSEAPDAGKLDERLAVFAASYQARQRADQDPFVAFLYENAGNRGIMADLRAGLSPTRRFGADVVLARFGSAGPDPRTRDRHKARQYIGAWFAMYPSRADDGNVGTFCRSLLSLDEARSLDSTGEPGPLTKRFLHLLQADGDEVYGRLSSFVLRAKSAGSPARGINYSQWLKDLYQWPRQSDRIKEDWATSYWAVDLEVAQAVPDILPTESEGAAP
jgi:CRISPR type I-E-associated protein CasB/Cse2